MKKKVGLFLGTEPNNGGKFQHTQTVLDAFMSLPQEQFDKVIAYAPAAWLDRLSSLPVKVVHTPDGLCRWFFDRFWKNLYLPTSLWMKMAPAFYSTAKSMQNEKCDLWVFPSEDTVSYQVGVPALSTIFDLMHRYGKNFPEVAALGRAHRRDVHYKNVCRYSKGVLVDSEMGKQQVVESYGMAPDKIHILPYIAPPYLLAHEPQTDFDQRYPLPNKFIFYPAQLFEHKNHRGLIRALALLKPEIPDLKLVLVGPKKNSTNTVVQLIDELQLQNDVLFLGYVPDCDMSEIYLRARAMMMPTFFGPTNIPPLEAFAMGCPVGISNLYGMPEQAGDAALFFDPSSVEDIAVVMRRLWCDDALCQNLKEKGLARTKKWGQQQFNERFASIVTQVLGEKR